MKRSKQSDEPSLAVQQTAPKKPNANSLAVKDKTREQLIDKLASIACKVTGTQHHKVADRIIAQLGGALIRPKPNSPLEQEVKASLMIWEMAPQNLTEAMLATQMIAAHDAALMFLARATVDGQYPEAIDANVLRATRLMRIFTEQLEATQKLRGKACQQKITVEHVHVHEGGQAIVGAVSQTGATSETESKDHP